MANAELNKDWLKSNKDNYEDAAGLAQAYCEANGIAEGTEKHDEVVDAADDVFNDGNTDEEESDEDEDSSDESSEDPDGADSDG